jgi:hypothetical protein
MRLRLAAMDHLWPRFSVLIRFEARSHERQKIPSGASLAAETSECASEESRLQPGLAAPQIT